MYRVYILKLISIYLKKKNHLCLLPDQRWEMIPTS